MDLAKLNIEINSKDALTANKRLGRLALTGKSLDKQVVSLSTSSRQLTGRMSIAAKRFRTVGMAASRLGKTLSIGVTAPLLAIGATAAKVAADFESEMTRINTLVGLSAQTVDGFSKSVQDLASQTGRGPRELARALFTVTSAGARGAESLEILEQAAKASAIGLGDTQGIARATTAVLQAYGKENISAARATEVLVSTVREGNLEAADLAPVLGRVLGMASQLGISFEEVGANIATFTRLGVGAEEAVVGLRGVMNALLKPTNEGAKALAEVGVTFESLRRSVEEKGLAGTLSDLVGLFNGNEEALSQVIPNVRALANVLGTAGAQGEAYNEIVNNINNNHGLVADGFKTVGETAKFQWEQAKAQLEVAAVSLRDSLLPAMKQVVSVVQGAAKWFSDMDSATQRNVVTYGLLAAAVGPVLIVVGKLIAAIPTLIGLFQTLNTVIRANPWVALASVVGTLAALLVGKYLTSTNEATEATSKFEKAIRETGASVKEAASQLEGLTLQKMFDNTLDTIKNLRMESRQLESQLRADFKNVQDSGRFVNATFQEWLETLEKTYGRSGKTGKFMDIQDTLDDLKAQKILIRDLNKLEVGRANILGTVGGEMERLSAFAREQIRQTEERIDKIRSELGLSIKYTEQEKATTKAVEETNTALEERKSVLDEIWGSVPDATNITNPLDLIDQAILGLPVSIEQLERARQQLEQTYRSTTSARTREETQAYIEDLEEIIANLEGVDIETNNVKNTQREMNTLARNFGMTFSSALEDAIVNFKDLRSVAQGFIQDLIRIAARAAIIEPLKDAFVGFLGNIGLGSGSGATQQNAKGGIFGGMTTMGSQMFGEAGPEAVLPLTRNSRGQLAVQASGGGGNVQVNIHNYTNQKVETRERQTANGGKQLDVMVGSMLAKDVEQRGPMARALENTYGLNRTSRRRN